MIRFLFLFFFLLSLKWTTAQVGIQSSDIYQMTKLSVKPPEVEQALPPLLEVFKTTSPLLSPKAYSFEDLAFFCKIEVHLEKATQIPIKFRLGDVQYVDWLEGKRDFPNF